MFKFTRVSDNGRDIVNMQVDIDINELIADRVKGYGWATTPKSPTYGIDDIFGIKIRKLRHLRQSPEFKQAVRDFFDDKYIDYCELDIEQFVRGKC